MKALFVSNNWDQEVFVPEPMGIPRHDQLKGSWAEQLIECAGRVCYDAVGSGRPSGEYHKNLLLTQKHLSVAEHVHFTIEADLPAIVLHGIPDYSIAFSEEFGGMARYTFNLRHALEWPNNLLTHASRFSRYVERWDAVMKQVAFSLLPNVLEEPQMGPTDALWKFVPPIYDEEKFVTLFLEDSLVWSLEMNRHRFNISQRSGRFCDQTDRDDCIHPLLKAYLNQAGFLALNQEDGEKLWCDVKEGVTVDAINARTKLGNAIGSHLTQSKMVYMAVVEHLQPWLMDQGFDKITARKQARSAARYYLGQGLSTEKLFSASLRGWRHIFEMRCSPHADAAIATLMTQAQKLVFPN